MMAQGQRMRAAVGPVLLLVAVAGPGWAVAASGPPLPWRVADCTPGPGYVFSILHSADPLRHMRPWAVVATRSLPRPRAGRFQERVVYLCAHEVHKPASALLDPGSQIALF